ncbi:MAG TPA: hypothetical protein VFY93_19725 [Planctomycetota bacterium]|nr:hypothetical protein [Planctomycetota bacterium]
MKRALVLALLLAGCAAGLKQVGMRSPALATTWIGVASDGLTWYRLDLGDNGTGAAATTKGQETAFYRVRQWSDADGMTVHLEVADGPPAAPRRLDLSGSSSTWRLELAVEGRHTVTLWRERELLAARERMAGHGPATTANPP